MRFTELVHVAFEVLVELNTHCLHFGNPGRKFGDPEFRKRIHWRNAAVRQDKQQNIRLLVSQLLNLFSGQVKIVNNAVHHGSLPPKLR